MSRDARGTWDFFISYTQADRAWAEWIAWVLEEDGYRVLIQAWDFVPGTNWIHRMQDGIRKADRMIAVLSSDYLDSVFGGVEWQTVWASDPQGADRRLLVVRVAECERPALLTGMTGFDLFGLTEPEARDWLRKMISAALSGRDKPAVAPEFPGQGRTVPNEPRFPGLPQPSETGRAAPETGEPGVDDAHGLGRRLFTARIPQHSGQLSVAFGAGGTLVVVEKDTTVHRWSLRDGTRLPGAPASPAPGFNLWRVDVGTRIAVSTEAPTVAFSRGGQVTLLHFGEGGYRTAMIPLDSKEFLVPANGERFATSGERGIKVRDFATGSVIWQAPAPRNLASSTMDPSGRTVAMAGGPNIVVGSNKVVVTAQDDPHPFEFSFANLPLAAGCQLGISPDRQLVACASFREIVVFRPRTGEIVHKRQLAGMGEDVRSSLGIRPHRLICTPRGGLLWFRGRRVVDVNWPGDKNRYLPQDGLCDDIAFDHATSRLAMVNESGQVDVFQWNFGELCTACGWTEPTWRGALRWRVTPRPTSRSSAAALPACGPPTT